MSGGKRVEQKKIKTNLKYYKTSHSITSQENDGRGLGGWWMKGRLWERKIDETEGWKAKEGS
jgi:hypothetical protein